MERLGRGGGNLSSVFTTTPASRCGIRPSGDGWQLTAQGLTGTPVKVNLERKEPLELRK